MQSATKVQKKTKKGDSDSHTYQTSHHDQYSDEQDSESESSSSDDDSINDTNQTDPPHSAFNNRKINQVASQTFENETDSVAEIENESSQVTNDRDGRKLHKLSHRSTKPQRPRFNPILHMIIEKSISNEDDLE